MLESKTFRLAATLLGMAALCLPVAVLGNGAAPEAEAPQPEAAAQPSQPEAAPPPAGAGPAEVAAGISVAPISAIRQRGHVQNVCEAQAMMQQSVRDNGGMNTFGDYQVAYMLDPPKGWYETRDGRLTWIPPGAGDTQHIEVVVMDALTGQPIPIQPLMLEVVDPQGDVMQSKELVYYWHPMAGHYGANYSIPTAGSYTLRVRAPVPGFRRHDRNLGDRFTTPLDATFTNVSISPKAPEAMLPTAETQPETIAPPAGSGPAGTGDSAETSEAQPSPQAEEPSAPLEEPEAEY